MRNQREVLEDHRNLVAADGAKSLGRTIGNIVAVDHELPSAWLNEALIIRTSVDFPDPESPMTTKI